MRAHTHTHAHTHKHAHTQTRVHTHTHTYARAHTVHKGVPKLDNICLYFIYDMARKDKVVHICNVREGVNNALQSSGRPYISCMITLAVHHCYASFVFTMMSRKKEQMHIVFFGYLVCCKTKYKSIQW